MFGITINPYSLRIKVITCKLIIRRKVKLWSFNLYKLFRKKNRQSYNCRRGRCIRLRTLEYCFFFNISRRNRRWTSYITFMCRRGVGSFINAEKIKNYLYIVRYSSVKSIVWYQYHFVLISVLWWFQFSNFELIFSM